jgi:hypothetical protein
MQRIGVAPAKMFLRMSSGLNGSRNLLPMRQPSAVSLHSAAVVATEKHSSTAAKAIDD